MQVQLDAITKYDIDFDIKWNPLKTEYIIFNKDLVRSKEEMTTDHWLGMLQLSNEVISEVEQFRYLGVWISNKTIMMFIWKREGMLSSLQKPRSK